MARAMKDSGIEWIGEIPEDWGTMPLKRVLLQNDGGVWGDDPSGENDDIVLRSTEQTVDGKWCIDTPAKRNLSSVPDLDYFRCLAGDLLITKSSGSSLHIGKTTLVTEEVQALNCYYSNFIQRIRVKDPEHPKFYWYILNSNIARDQFAYLQNTTSGIGNINSTYIAELIVPIVPFENQRRIAAYLDRKCAEIDSVIANTQKTIEEYKVLKQSIITEAVTKGVRGNRPMKYSGIEWIGEIPEEWNIVKITRLLNYDVVYPIGDGDHGLIGPNDYQETGVPYIRVQNLGWGTPITIDGMVFISKEKNEIIKNSTLHPGDVLFAKTGATIGKTGIVPDTIPIANTTSHVGKLTIAPKYDSKWVFYVLSSTIGYRQFWEIARQKTTRPELSIDEIKSVKLPVPISREEQEEVVKYLDIKCQELDRLIAAKEHLLTELETYKKSVIYEYVTGKKEVPACP